MTPTIRLLAETDDSPGRPASGRHTPEVTGQVAHLRQVRDFAQWALFDHRFRCVFLRRVRDFAQVPHLWQAASFYPWFHWVFLRQVGNYPQCHAAVFHLEHLADLEPWFYWVFSAVVFHLELVGRATPQP